MIDNLNRERPIQGGVGLFECLSVRSKGLCLVANYNQSTALWVKRLDQGKIGDEIRPLRDTNNLVEMGNILRFDVVDAGEQDRQTRPKSVAVRDKQPVRRIIRCNEIPDMFPCIALGNPIRQLRLGVGATNRETECV